MWIGFSPREKGGWPGVAEINMGAAAGDDEDVPRDAAERQWTHSGIEADGDGEIEGEEGKKEVKMGRRGGLESCCRSQISTFCSRG